MPHAVKLPTNGSRKYRGKYPTRFRQYSSGGAEAPIVAKHLGTRSPIFVELNNGDRYYIDGFYLSTFNLPKHSWDARKTDFEPIIANHTRLDIHAYNRMLAEIKQMRHDRLMARTRGRGARA
jgi:hypothetical protein